MENQGKGGEPKLGLVFTIWLLMLHPFSRAFAAKNDANVGLTLSLLSVFTE